MRLGARSVGGASRGCLHLRRHIFLTVPTLILGLLLGQLGGLPTALAAVAPSVSALAPTAGPLGGGTEVTVTGTGLAGATRVTFGGVAGTSLTVLSDSQLRVMSPPRSTRGAVAVLVTTLEGTSGASTASTFTYRAAPTVTKVAPSSGPLAGGTVVTITGTDLTEASSVTFGDRPGTALQLVSATQLKVTAPTGVATGPVQVQVTTPLGASPAIAASTYTYVPVPVVTDVSPPAGPLGGGTPVTVTGTGLTGATKVTFGSLVGTALSVVSDAELRVTTPARSSTGAVDVRVTTIGGTSAVSTKAKYSYRDAPTVIGLSPSSGPLAGGTIVTVTGSNLGLASEVAFGDRFGTQIQVVSETQLKVTAPAGAAPGAVSVRVTTPGGTTAADPTASFSYIPAPAVTGVAPSAGPLAGGTVVTISGTELARATSVTFGGTPAAGLTVVSDNELLVTSPARVTAGAVDVQVVTAGGPSPTGVQARFSYRVAPTVTAVSPSSGPLAGGTAVTLTGTDLAGASAVTFGGRPGTQLQVLSDTQLTVTAPAGAADGAVEILVTTPGGSSAPTTAASFTYETPNAAPAEYCGTLEASQTWDTSRVRVVTCDLVIPAGVSLTLGAGAVIKVGSGVNIGVEGSLVAAGTTTTPVTITSLKDDSIRGDTNGGGATIKPAAGDWYGINVGAGATLDIVSTVVRYGGGLSVWDAAKLSVVNSELRYGVPLSVYRSESAIGPITVSGTTIAAVGSRASSGLIVDVRNDRAGIAPTVRNNVVTGVTRYPGDVDGGRAMTISGPQLLSGRLTGNTGSGNAQNALFVSGSLAQSVILPTTGLRWVIDNKSYSSLTVLPGVTMTLKAGAVLKLARGAHIYVQGSLIGAGTATADATITSLKDDAVGGDTNGGGATSMPAAGDWSGIYVSSGATLDLVRTTIAYGSTVSVHDAASVSVVDSKLRNGVPLSIYRSDDAAGPITVTGTTVSAVGSVHTSGITVDVRNHRDGMAPSVMNNSVTGVLSYDGHVEGGRAITVSGPELLPSRLTGNTGSGNTQDALFLSGTVAESATVPTSGLPWVVDRSWPYAMTVADGAVLTLEAGTVLKVVDSAQIVVEGSLVANGTADAPVTVTSLRDDLGGDTNGDGEGIAAAGDWSGMYVYGGGLDLRHATVRYGGSITASDATAVSVVDSELRDGVSLSVYRSESVTGSVTVTGNLVADVGAGLSGISVDVRDDRDGIAPRVSGNTVTGSVRYDGDEDGGRAITVSGPRLLPSLLTGNVGSDNAQNALFLSGSIAESATVPTSGLPWVVDRSWPWSLTVRPGVTLTLAPGTVLKVAQHAHLAVEGALVGAGTDTSPVTITGLRDDGPAGDTNGDATGTTPAAGEWDGISVGQGATLDLVRTTVRYGSGVWASNAAKLSIVDSQLRNGVPLNVYRGYTGTGPITVTRTTVADVGETSGSGINIEVYYDRDGIAPTITSNTVTGVTRYPGDVDGGRAITVSGPRLLPARLTGNTGSANTQNALFLSGSLAGNAALPAAGLRWVIDRSWQWGFTVRPGVTLTLKAGAVLKVSSGANLNIQGSLVGTGTATSPAAITSLRDDAIGGNTDGNGPGSPAANDWSGISVATAATLNLSRTVVAYGGNVTAGDAATFSVVDSQVRGGMALSAYRSATASGPITVTGTTVSDVGYANSGISVDVQNDRDGISPTVANNTVTGAQRYGDADVDSGRAITVSGPRLLPSRLVGNKASGNAQNALFVSGSIAESVTLPTAGIPWVIDRNWNWQLTVRPEATLALATGATLKAVPEAALYVAGTLTAAGTPSAPVSITSLRDDSVGGDLDGASPPPAVGDWAGIVVSAGGKAQLDGTTLRYADTALAVHGGTEVAIHGRIIDAHVGVWSQTYVDATHVDWGDPSGPAPHGSGPEVVGGGIVALPWVGWVAPQLPPRTPAGTTPDIAAGCKQVMFLAVRGSSENPYERSDDAAYGGSWLAGFGDRVWNLYGGFTASWTERGYALENQKGIGLRYTAMHVPYTDEGERAEDIQHGLAYNSFEYGKSIWEGVDRIEQYLRDEHARCGTSQKYVLSGYSQGALAIHIYLNFWAPDDILSQIAAVGLIADPAKIAYGAERTYTDGFVLAGDNIRRAQGLYDPSFLGSGPLPSEVVGRTVTMCHNDDMVCAPGWGSSPGPHGNYSPTEMADMGKKLAEIAVASGLPAR